ncbi:MAG: TetR family transcriptional regulator, partial [Thermoleophilia bacterium]|nr:TetR family transcriptional regulator [Thermoleophilia bacterium]
MEGPAATGSGTTDLATRTRRSPDPVGNRDRLIEATIHCIATYGPAGATVKRITDVAGLSRGLVRHHFGGKQALVREAFLRLAGEMRAAFRSDGTGEPDAVAAMRTAIRNEFEDALASPTRAHAWFGFWQAALGDPEIRRANEELYAEEREHFTELFRLTAQQ